VIQGINSESICKLSILKEDKDFKIVTPAIILTNENYKVIKLKKIDVLFRIKRIKCLIKSKTYTELLGKQIEL
jgi:hypothetical protein